MANVFHAIHHVGPKTVWSDAVLLQSSWTFQAHSLSADPACLPFTMQYFGFPTSNGAFKSRVFLKVNLRTVFHYSFSLSIAKKVLQDSLMDWNALLTPRF